MSHFQSVVSNFKSELYHLQLEVSCLQSPASHLVLEVFHLWPEVFHQHIHVLMHVHTLIFYFCWKKRDCVLLNASSNYLSIRWNVSFFIIVLCDCGMVREHAVMGCHFFSLNFYEEQLFLGIKSGFTIYWWATVLKPFLCMESYLGSLHLL